MREKVGKSRNTVFFQWFVAPEGRKVGSLKRRVRSPAGQTRDEKLHAVVVFQMCFAPQRRALFRHFFDIWTSKSGPRPSVLTLLTWKCASRHNGVHFFDIATSKSGPNPWCFVHFDLEMCFAPQRRALFRHRNLQKWSEPLVFCTFWLGNVLRATTACTFSTSQLPKVVRRWGVLYILSEAHFEVKMYKAHHSSDHFWKLRCQKSARRCGAKHILKSKCTKHLSVGPLLEVVMSKKCTPLWREAHFQVKMYKTPGVRTTFGGCDVEKVHAVVARSTFPSQNVQNTRGSDHFWRLRCRKSARRCGAKHISKSKVLKLTVSDHFWRFRCRKSVEKVHAVVARSTFGSQKCKNWGFWAFFDVLMSKK